MRDTARDRQGPSRRALLKGGTALALSAASYRRVLGANDRIGLGFIGFGLIGKRHVLDFKAQPDADLVAVAEVHQARLAEAAATMGGSPRTFGDFRRLLDDRDVDAVVVSTPDHWHALMTMMACAAGKDVYVEKPLTLFVREGRWMVDVARRNNRVVQVGTQQRSGPHYQAARDLVRAGHIGKVVSVRMCSYRNIMPGFGSPPDGDPPPGLDYDMWLGPAPKRPYNPNRAPLPLPLALGLLGRADDQPRPALARHRPLVPGRLGAEGRGKPGGAVRAPGQRRDARHTGLPVRVRRLDRRLVAPRGEPRYVSFERPRILRHQGEPDHLPQGIHRHARRRDAPGGGRPPIRWRAPGRGPGVFDQGADLVDEEVAVGVPEVGAEPVDDQPGRGLPPRRGGDRDPRAGGAGGQHHRVRSVAVTDMAEQRQGDRHQDPLLHPDGDDGCRRGGGQHELSGAFAADATELAQVDHADADREDDGGQDAARQILQRPGEE